MYVLGIETSCDETSAAIVKDGSIVLSNEVSSSLNFHKKYGGVVPEIAFRAQLETIAQVTDAAVKTARIKLKDIGLVSVTSGPGLLGSLVVGISFAKAVSFSLGIPLLGANHVHSHIYANFLNRTKVKLPFVALVVSGGHTSLFYIKDFNRIETIGQTQDDACGETFDKVAKILDLGYPGGPIISTKAKNGHPSKFNLPRPMMDQPNLNFSFSGLKTSVLYHVQKHGRPRGEALNDFCAAVEQAIVDVLIKKTIKAAEKFNVKTIMLGGGVAANQKLRNSLIEVVGQKLSQVHCWLPEIKHCGDNGLMTAMSGFYNKPVKNGWQNISVDPNLEIAPKGPQGGN